MKPRFTAALILLLSLFLALPAFSQWIDFADETSTRLVLSTVPSSDGEEKDVSAADVNNDGWTDVIVARKNPFSNAGAREDLLLINVSGVLTDMTTLYAPEFITNPSDARDLFIGDFDNDGWKDVVIANTFEQQPIYYSNLGELGGEWQGFADESSTRFPTITIPALQFCAVWAGDLTGNGYLDIFYSNYREAGTAFDVLFINDGTGNFTEETVARMGDYRNSAFGTSTQILDMDNDGDEDIVKTSTLYSVPPWGDLGNFILFNDGTGNFSTYDDIPSNEPYMFTIGDLNNDGLQDAYIVDDFQDYANIAISIVPNSSITYSMNTLSSSPRTTRYGGNVKMYDLDDDGDLDIAVADVDVDIPPCESGASDLRKFTILQNQGTASGNLFDPWGTADNHWNESTYDFDYLDIDNDGKMDIFQCRCRSYAVLRQESSAAATATISVDAQYDPVPAIGDTFPVDMSITNNTASTITVELWIDLRRPDNVTTTALAPRTIGALPGNGTLNKAPIVRVSGNGPSGTYTLLLNWVVNGDTSVTTTTFEKSGSLALEGNGAMIPDELTLQQNYPNPFNPTTTIRYGLKEDSFVSLKLFNALGQEVTELYSENQTAGYHQVNWDGTNNFGQPVATGVYVYQLTAIGISSGSNQSVVLTRKMLLSK